MPDLRQVFDELHRRLSVHEDAFLAGKRYVSYYLMSVYADPTALDKLSPELRRRMQGRSCFNFTRVDEELFDELAELTLRGRDQYAAAGLLRG